jgi:hypothetical protein
MKKTQAMPTLNLIRAVTRPSLWRDEATTMKADLPNVEVNRLLNPTKATKLKSRSYHHPQPQPEYQDTIPE